MCPPAIPFLVKNVNFKLNLYKNSTKLHIPAKFGMADLFMDPIFHLIENQKMSGCFKRELFEIKNTRKFSVAPRRVSIKPDYLLKH